jgi:hypothetical protein
MSFLQPAEAESRRFGLHIARGQGELADADALLDDILRLGVDVAIVRLPSTATDAMARIAGCGMAVIHADTLVYYQCRLDHCDPPPARNSDLDIAQASASDHAELAVLARLCFADYASHYAANPLLNRRHVADGYMEWAVSHLQQRGNVWVARRHGTMIGFICCDDRAAEDVCEIVLNGVNPAHAGGGVYGDLVRHVQRHFASLGRYELKVSTQIINVAVQRAWAREGFALATSMQTFHVNALLDCGELVLDRAITLEPPAHAADEGTFADGGVAHAMESAIRAAIPHARLRRTSLIYRAPCRPGTDFRLQLRLPSGRITSGSIQAVATLGNATGERCAVGYCDLMIGG